MYKIGPADFDVTTIVFGVDSFFDCGKTTAAGASVEGRRGRCDVADSVELVGMMEVRMIEGVEGGVRRSAFVVRRSVAFTEYDSVVGLSVVGISVVIILH